MAQQIRRTTTNNTPARKIFTPTDPVPNEQEPIVPGSGNEALERNLTQSGPDVCFIPDHTGIDTILASQVTEMEVAIPGTTIVTNVKVCVVHKGMLDKARGESVEKAKAAAEAPYGRCHVCSQPVGLRQPGAPKPKDGILTFWRHLNNLNDVCHETCYCTAVAENGEKVGRKRKTVEA